jgi:hypothetical protein
MALSTTERNSGGAGRPLPALLLSGSPPSEAFSSLSRPASPADESNEITRRRDVRSSGKRRWRRGAASCKGLKQLVMQYQEQRDLCPLLQADVPTGQGHVHVNGCRHVRVRLKQL